MADQTLMFGMLGIGGLLIVSAISNKPLSTVIHDPAGTAAGIKTTPGIVTLAGAATQAATIPTIAGVGSSADTSGMTPEKFARQLLQELGAPVTNANVQSIVNWYGHEGGNWHNTASYNPLNTTLELPGSSVMAGGSSAGVQAYTSWQQGLEATVLTLENGDYNDILQALRSGNGLTGYYQGLEIWSGNGYAAVN